MLKNPVRFTLKLRTITLATVCTVVFPLCVVKAEPPNATCQAYLDTSSGTDDEKNNCPITVGTFSIRGTFSNPKWQVSFGAWEPAYYILFIKNKQDGSVINLTGFNVMGTTSRPQYRFTERDRTYVVTFRYSDPNTIRLEVYENNRVLINELLIRESDKLLGGP